MWHPADPGSERQRHDASAGGCRLAVEQLKVIHYLLDKLRRLVLVDMEDLQIADLIGAWHRMNRGSPGVEPVGHVIVDPVANVLAPFGGYQLERVGGFGKRR